MSRYSSAQDHTLTASNQPQQDLQLPQHDDDSIQHRPASSSSRNVSQIDSAAAAGEPAAPEADPSGPSSRDPKGKRKADNHQDGWLAQTYARFGSLNLENKGSVARDHLALERTFLAWLRTSLSFASIGIAVTQLFRLNASIGNSDPASEKGAMTLRRMGKPLGATFLGIAILVLLIGLNRYYESQNWLLKGKFPASRGSILFLTVVAASLIICSLSIILAVNPSVVNG
ncbi:hypothetical protein ABW21_db0202043 [Orbilia brochopaga]|nr:hypothetical protein ABW21_db0202043 [Drechslerella brochopaga]